MSFLHQTLDLLLNKFDHVVYIGPGNGAALSALENCADRLTLVEPNPKNAAALKRKQAQFANSDIQQKAITLNDGQAELNLTIPSGFSSVVKPTGLKQYYPGLNIQETITVDTVTLPTLVGQLQLESHSHNALILDVRGLESGIVKALQHNDLKSFSTVVLRSSNEPLYDAEYLDCDSINKELSRLGFSPLFLNDNQPPFCTLIGVRPLSLANKTEQLSDKVGKLEQQLSVTEQEKQDAANSVEHLKSRLFDEAQSSEKLNNENKVLEEKLETEKNEKTVIQEKLKELDVLRNLLAERDEKIGTLSSELNERENEKQKLVEESDQLKRDIESLRKERDGLEYSSDVLTERDKQIDSLSSQLDGKEKEKQQLAEQADELRRNIDSLQKERDEQAASHHKYNERMEELRNQLNQAQRELKEQQRSAQLSTKLLTKVEADCSDLRERYAEKMNSEQELKDLIKELHAKLQAASHFYHKLEQEHPELLEKL
ncbi:hypothetical protein [Alteromonas halophila]|uniref:FkbM family methyltransferase n=1 Tax=Alteromonas halophila TaxID=516698 RepID=A0A918MWZ1_9ALTE|nr:hypothetical protein [Alteromonas halophila]GGW82399.1 hypothetical protein GCM10007391_14300 [Alteromonas halophila]